MNKATELFNNVVSEVLKNIECIELPQDKAKAYNDLLTAIAKTGAVEGKYLFINAAEAPQEKPEKVNTAEVTREDIKNKPNTSEEAAANTTVTEPAKVVNEAVSTANDNTAVVETVTPQNVDTWTTENKELYAKDFYFVNLYCQQMKNSGYSDFVKNILTQCSGGAITEYVDENTVPPTLIKYVAAVLRQNIEQNQLAQFEAYIDALIANMKANEKAA